MSKKTKIIEYTDRNNRSIKDRGDLKTVRNKGNTENRCKEVDDIRIIYPGGDTRKIPTNERREKPKLAVEIKIPSPRDDVEPKAEDFESAAAAAAAAAKKANEKILSRALLDIKKIREKYTMRHPTPNVPVSQPVKKEETPKETFTEKNDRSVATDEGISIKEKPCIKETQTSIKKPIISTITTKSDTYRRYKAVKFVERKPTASLQIKLPDTNKKQVSKETDTNFIKSVVAAIRECEKREKEAPPVKTKVVRKREKRVSRPRVPKNQEHNRTIYRSPSTEVAKWAPASITKDTKPYYEAWVNTTLAAFSKGTKRDLAKYKIPAGVRPHSPDLIYKLSSDERYTGKIKIRQR